MRLVDIDALDAAMYHKSFEVDDGRNVWNSGLWIRYKIYEEASREAPTVDAVPVDLINRIIEADGSEDQSNAISLLSLLDTWRYVKRKEGE